MEVETPAQTQRGAHQQACMIGTIKQQLPTGAGAAAKPLHHNPLLVVNFLLMIIGSACGPLFLRAYFLYGGNRKWLSSLLQTAGWPLLLAPLSASFLSRRRCSSATTPLFLMSPRILAATVGIGLMTGLDNLLYAYGLAYLPVSTSSILISTQLAFTAGFALLLVRQRFTAFSVNAVVLLSVGAAMLGMNAGGDRPAGVSRAQYSAGFAMTLGAAALYGLVLAVMELSQARHAARAGCAVTYTLVMEMQVVIGFTATAFSAVGMLVNNDFHRMAVAIRGKQNCPMHVLIFWRWLGNARRSPGIRARQGGLLPAAGRFGHCVPVLLPWDDRRRVLRLGPARRRHHDRPRPGHRGARRPVLPRAIQRHQRGRPRALPLGLRLLLIRRGTGQGAPVRQTPGYGASRPLDDQICIQFYVHGSMFLFRFEEIRKQ